MDLHITDLPDQDLKKVLKELSIAQVGEDFAVSEGQVYYVPHNPEDAYRIEVANDQEVVLKSLLHGDSSSRHTSYANYLLRTALNDGSLKLKG